MDMKRVVVHIDRLVVAGLREKDAESVGAGIRGELARLLANSTASARLASLGHVPSMHAGVVKVASEAAPHLLGVASARAIGKRVSK